MRVLITGITGFVGSHLAEYLLSKGNIEVYGTVRWRSQIDNIRHIIDRLKLYECDLKDATSVRRVIDEVKPDWIFHLAAQSFVHASWHSPAETLTTNVISQINVFEAVRLVGINPRIHIAGSSEEYGFVLENEIPIKETNPLRPLSPYAVSKVAQDFLGYQYFKSYNMSIIRTRAFNHTGPRRGEVFVESNFAKQLALIKKGKQAPVVYVGNLDAIRDFTDVRDIIRAYLLALEKCQAGEVYNICSGKGYKIKEILDMLIRISGIKSVEIKQDPSRLRPSDVPCLIGDCSKFKNETGWKAEIPFEKTLRDLFSYWEERV